MMDTAIHIDIYISGSITGTDDYLERFAAAEEALKAQENEVINPARINAQLPSTTTYTQYMNMFIIMLDMAEAIYMLRGWKKSEGACIEYGYALAKDKTIVYQDN